MKGKQPASLRCKKCGYDESTTSDTLFHKLKFSIHKAFDIHIKNDAKTLAGWWNGYKPLKEEYQNLK